MSSKKSKESYVVIADSPVWLHQGEGKNKVFPIGTKLRLISLDEFSPIGQHHCNDMFVVCREGIACEWLGIEKYCIEEYTSEWSNLIDWSEILV